MSLYEDIDALTEDKSRQVFVTERRNGYTVTNFGDPLVSVSELRAILARHPEADASDGEREALATLLLGHGHVAWQRFDAETVADVVLAAGYRNRPMPSVDEVADHLRLIHFDGTGCGTTGTSACSNCYGPSPMSAPEVATAVLALLNPKEES